MQRCSVLVVGAGPAGLAAAYAAAEGGADVLMIDENPSPGGQIWRAYRGRVTQNTADLLDPRVRLLLSATVLDLQPGRALVRSQEGTQTVAFERIILCTGARERFLPFPGWTLPGVFGVGGLQALVKQGLSVAGKRIVVSGSGPLLLSVASAVRKAGGRVIGIAEQAPAAAIRRFVLHLAKHPGRLATGIGLRAELASVPYLTGAWVADVVAGEENLNVRVVRGRREHRLECDMLACAFGFVPNVELAQVAGCTVTDGVVVTDEMGFTSQVDILCAGEPRGIAGVDAARWEGFAAGAAATGQLDRARSYALRAGRCRDFGAALEKAFALRGELTDLSRDDTVVCRCEDVAWSALRHRADWREAKLQTRCGMGPCQGRVCGPALHFLKGWEKDSARPPIHPATVGELFGWQEMGE